MSLYIKQEIQQSSSSEKAKFFVKNFSKNSNLDDSDISLPDFPSGAYLKLHNISVTSKMVENVITGLDSSKILAEHTEYTY